MQDYNNIIIQIRDNIPLHTAMQTVNSVVANGKGENGKYPFRTPFNTLKGEVYVYARQYTKKDSFVVAESGDLKKIDLQ